MFFISELQPLPLMTQKAQGVRPKVDNRRPKRGKWLRHTDIPVILTLKNFCMTFCQYDVQCLTTNVPKQDGRQHKTELISDGHSRAITG